MRLLGAQAFGVRLPIVKPGDDLAAMVAEYVTAAKPELKNDDVVGVTEAVVAKAQGNYAELQDIATDVKAKFGDATVGVVFPILSRNRFLNILKGIAAGAKEVVVLVSAPSDEVGNPVMEPDDIDKLDDMTFPMTAADFRKATGGYVHPFTGVDYLELYENASNNIKVFVSPDPRDILKLTDNIIAADIHNRMRTKKRLERAGAKLVYTLSDILSTPQNNSGFNPDYGVLGSNMSTQSRLKLFPRDTEQFIAALEQAFMKRLGFSPLLLVYGDGAFKDPACSIWELADPVVSPAHSARLGGQPNEIKLKYVADMAQGDAKEAVESAIKTKHENTDAMISEGTTPRKYADLIGSLCDLMSGSGDKGTPVIVISGYFDDYTVQ